MIPCAHCATPFQPRRPEHRFCRDTCRAAWHRAQHLPGAVTGIRALKRGGWSLTIHYPSIPDGVILGSAVRLDTTPDPRMDAYCGANGT